MILSIFYVPIDHWYILLYKRYVQLFCLLLKLGYWTFIIKLYNHLYSWNLFFITYSFTNIFSHSVTFLYIFFMVFFDEQEI